MFVSKNQIFVFFACVAFGGVAAIFMGLICGVKYILKNKIVGHFLDFTALIVVAISYVYYSFCLRFPSLRVYMPLGVLVGILLYFKSIHIILAKNLKKVYNITVNKIMKVKNDRIKSKKTDSGNNGGRSNASSDFTVSND